MTEQLPIYRYEVQHGPDDETHYAWVYSGNEMIATMRTHHAKAICEAMNTLASNPTPATRAMGSTSSGGDDG